MKRFVHIECTITKYNNDTIKKKTGLKTKKKPTAKQIK